MSTFQTIQFIYSFLNLFMKYLLNAYYVLSASDKVEK